MELRHLRYFVAVAEEGSLLNAAERRLNTSQPSLSRQIRDLEGEVGVQLLERQARGVALTAAGSACFSIMRGWRCCRLRPQRRAPGKRRNHNGPFFRWVFSSDWR